MYLPRGLRGEVSALWPLAALLLSGTAGLPGQVVTIKEYPLPDLCLAESIAAGPDGALWFTVDHTVDYRFVNKIGRMSMAGVVTLYPAGGRPGGITAGPDGALWFVASPRISRITTEGALTQLPYPNNRTGTRSITAGPDGALWLALGDRIGRLTTAGAMTEYPLPFGAGTITNGPDGALWFTGGWGIGRITTAGRITGYPAPSHITQGITAGPDGALWFAFTDWTIWEVKIGRITTAGVVTEYRLPSAGQIPLWMMAGPDGALWFTVWDPGAIDQGVIARITTAGVIAEYPLPSGTHPGDIAAGPDGNLWFTSHNRPVLGQIIFGPLDTTKPVSHVSPLPGREAIANFPVQWSGTDTGYGIGGYTIYVSDNGSPFNPWLLQTSATQAVFPGTAGHVYGFYSIARDWAGNQESPKPAAEATTQVAAMVPGDLNRDGRVDCTDLVIVKASFGKRIGQTGFDPQADFNVDGRVDVRDLAFVSQKLVPGASCPQ